MQVPSGAATFAIGFRPRKPQTHGAQIRISDCNSAGSVERRGSPADLHLLGLERYAAFAASVEPNLLRAVIVVESGFNSRAVSKRGAVGLMQLMPATATRFGVSNLFDPRQNVHAGARYLKFLIDRFGQNVRLALAAYNAGEEAVDRNGGQIPPFSETMAYVPRVLKIYRLLTEQTRAT